MTNRLKDSVSEMTRSATGDQSNFRIIEAIVEDTRHVVKSSIDDWADVIGDELIALERMRRLERKKMELKSTYEQSTDEKTTIEIESLEKQIDVLRSQIPSNLLFVSRKDEDYQAMMAAEWLADKHEEQKGYQFKVVAGGDYTTESDIEKINLNQELFLHKTKDNYWDVKDNSGAILGRVLNPLPYDYDVSVIVFERCYGTADLKVQFLEIAKKYEIRGGHFMHYVVRILNMPCLDTDGKTIIITE